MLVVEFRYRDPDGDYFYKEIALPDDAAQLIAKDKNGCKVFVGDWIKPVRADDSFKYKATRADKWLIEQGIVYAAD